MSHKCFGLFLAALIILSETAFAANEPSTSDAGLNDVFFLDGLCGWS